MAGRIIQLTPARRIIEPPFIDTSVRADIGDYGPPGWHLHGPLALKGRGKAASLGIAGAGDGDGGDAPQLCPTTGAALIVARDVTAATPNIIVVSNQIPQRFIISHIGWITNNDILLLAQSLQIYVSDDNNTSIVEPVTGQQIFAPYGDSAWQYGDDSQQHIYPNFDSKDPNKFIKVRLGRAASGADIRFSVVVDFLLFQ